MFCEQCGTQIGYDKRFCLSCDKIINQRSKLLLISAMIGCSIIVIRFILSLIIFNKELFLYMFLDVSMICASIAIILSFISWENKKTVFLIIASIIYGIVTIPIVIDLIIDDRYATIYEKLTNKYSLYCIVIFFIIPLILNIIVFIKSIKKK